MTGHHSIAHNRYLPGVVILISFGLYIFRFGYGYGSSDQDEVLPYLLHLLNPDLFQTDWFVQSQVDDFNVRTWFVYGLRVLCIFMPPFWAISSVYLASWLGCAAALHGLSYRLTASPLASLACIPIILVLTPFWTLGGNDLVHSMLVPSMAGWALGLWSVNAILENRPVRAGLLLGLATLAQALIGLQLAGLLGLYLIYIWLTEKRAAEKRRPVLIFGTVFLIVASPSIGPLIYQQLASVHPEGYEEMPSLFYIMGPYRHPHHYLFHSFDAKRMLNFFSLLAGGLISVYLLGRKQSLAFRDRSIIVLTALSALFCIIGYLGTEIWPVLPIAKLQLFKTTVLIKALMIIAVCTAGIQLLPQSVHDMIHQLLNRSHWSAPILGLALLILLWILQPDRFEQKVYPFSQQQEVTSDLFYWINDHTAEHALFAIPPSWSGFRSQAHRSVLINFKAFPYKDEDIYKWFNRLNEMAPLPLADRTTPRLPSRLDSSYHALSNSKLAEVAHRYNVDYVVRTTPLVKADSLFIPVYAVDGGYLYAVSIP